MLKGKKIIVTGGSGFLGKHLVEALKEKTSVENIFVPRSKDYDLREKNDVEKLFNDFPADFVIHLATTAGGIGYNKEHPGSLYYDHIIMNSLLMEIARKKEVKKFVAVGTALIYPGNAKIPLKEEVIWEGFPEESIAALGLSSKMMLAQSQAYRKEYGFNSIYVIPANLYGPGDHFEKERSHVIPATIRKFNEAVINGEKSVSMWGGGKASREFLYVKDAAEGIIATLEKYDKSEPLNLGSGQEITIRELVEKISKLVGYNGEIFWDIEKPEGQLRRCMDNSKIMKEVGFKARTGFGDGLKNAVEWYMENKDRFN
jgi:GDP-L-fucose synthase